MDGPAHDHVVVEGHQEGGDGHAETEPPQYGGEAAKHFCGPALCQKNDPDDEIDQSECRHF